MRRILITALIAAAPLVAHAQPQPAHQQTAAMPLELINRIYGFLQNGGTYAEAQGLREALLESAKAPQREADIQRRIDAAVAEARTKAPPAPDAAPK